MRKRRRKKEMVGRMDWRVVRDWRNERDGKKIRRHRHRHHHRPRRQLFWAMSKQTRRTEPRLPKRRHPCELDLNVAFPRLFPMSFPTKRHGNRHRSTSPTATQRCVVVGGGMMGKIFAVACRDSALVVVVIAPNDTFQPLDHGELPWHGANAKIRIRRPNRK